jgi:hypothetical protein
VAGHLLDTELQIQAVVALGCQSKSSDKAVGWRTSSMLVYLAYRPRHLGLQALSRGSLESVRSLASEIRIAT